MASSGLAIKIRVGPNLQVYDEYIPKNESEDDAWACLVA